MPVKFSLPEAYEWPIAETMAARFWPKVERRGDGECWSWLATLNHSGYGMIRNGAAMALAHRVAWVMEHGEVPDDLHVLHDCDTRRCVNVAHLRLGTNADNVRDKVERGRSSFPQPKKRGERHPMAKLTADQVDEIRQSTEVGRRLAEQFGVSPATICNIRKGKVWRP